MVLTNIEEIEKNGVKFFSCGSKKLSHNIQTKLSMVPVNVYKHRTTGKTINVFIMTDELSQFLKRWSENKPPKKGVVDE